MVISFSVDEASTEQNPDYILAGVSSREQSAAAREPYRYVLFARSLPIGSDEDWGIYVEFDDQSNAGYDCISRCQLTRDRLVVKLASPTVRQIRINTLDVSMRISDAHFADFVRGLEAIFVGQENRLRIVR
jgi:hypothetical protein